jgi:hypothetical protein
MNREVHVRFWERAEVQFLRATRQKAEPQKFPPPPRQTGKERLGRKWSDEQRVDNCNVPIELRGSKPRPNDCAGSVTTRSKD